MSVTLNRSYGTYAAGAVATFNADTEAAMVAQGIAAYTVTAGVNPTPAAPGGGVVVPGTFGPYANTNIPMGGTLLTAYETNGVAHTAWNTYIAEMFVPYWNTWVGASYLNGTGVGTDTGVVVLFNGNGNLIQTSAVAGVTNAAGASVWEDVPFIAPVTLAPGRYFTGLILSGATVTPRHILTGTGASPRTAQIATITSFAVALATLRAAPITVPATFTTALGPIMRLYS